MLSLHGRDVIMKRTIEGMIEAGEPLIRQATDALRLYHQAKAGGAPEQEVERLRLCAESLYQAVADYQLRALGEPGSTRH